MSQTRASAAASADASAVASASQVNAHSLTQSFTHSLLFTLNESNERILKGNFDQSVNQNYQSAPKSPKSNENVNTLALLDAPEGLEGGLAEGLEPTLPLVANQTPLEPPEEGLGQSEEQIRSYASNSEAWSLEPPSASHNDVKERAKAGRPHGYTYARPSAT